MKIKIARDMNVELDLLAEKVHDAPNEFERFLADQPNDLFWLGTTVSVDLKDLVVGQVKKQLPARQADVNADILARSVKIDRLEQELKTAQDEQAVQEGIKENLDFLETQIP